MEVRGTFESARPLARMNLSARNIATELKRIFVAGRDRMGWSLIDAFARLEERELQDQEDQEALNADAPDPNVPPK
jgi:hypothetical protein